MRKLFGEINLNWIKVIIFAVAIAAYTALINQVPFLRDTSFRDIAIEFECWILFGIIIIMNSKSNLDSALKCFVFFLISQPLIYLIEVPFLGWSIMGYYKNWIIWTLLTLPMGYIGYYMKKDKWWGLLILTPMLFFLGAHYAGYLGKTIFSFPLHLLSCIFCLATMFIYVLYIFKDKKLKIAGVIISGIIVIIMTVLTLLNPQEYNTTIFVSGGKDNLIFDDTYTAYLADKKYGELYFKYEEGIEDYTLNAKFKKAGKTEIIIESPSGEKTIYDITIKSDTYDLKKK